MDVRMPEIPDPIVIKDEIQALKARIVELRELLRLAEVQYVRRLGSQAKRDRARKHETDDGRRGKENGA